MKHPNEPYPLWRQRLLRAQAAWRRSKDRRLKAYCAFRIAGRQGLTLAISLLGAILVAYGMGMIARPAGFIVGGVLLWVLQWNYGGRRGSDG